ncbi:hypothetical protein Hanom_Chr03g00198041 [Helianthus anomalus]
MYLVCCVILFVQHFLEAHPHTRHNPPSYKNPTPSFFSTHKGLDREREICRQRVAATVSPTN